MVSGTARGHFEVLSTWGGHPRAMEAIRWFLALLSMVRACAMYEGRGIV